MPPLESGFSPEIIQVTPSIPGPGFPWDVTHSPSAISPGALRIEDRATFESYLVTLPTVNSLAVPGGPVYLFQGDNTQDILINCQGFAGNAFTKPVRVDGFINVFVQGLELDLDIEPGGAISQIITPGYNNQGRVSPASSNEFPRMSNGGIALIVDCSGDVWEEGSNFEANGMSGDYHVARGTDGPKDTLSGTWGDGDHTKTWTIQNSRFRGIQGDLVLHSDLFQQQGAWGGDERTYMRHLYLENIWVSYGQELGSSGGLDNHRSDMWLRNYMAIGTNENNPYVSADTTVGAYAGLDESRAWIVIPSSANGKYENCHYWQAGGFSVFGHYLPDRNNPWNDPDPSHHHYIYAADSPNIGGAGNSSTDPELHWVQNATAATIHAIAPDHGANRREHWI